MSQPERLPKAHEIAIYARVSTDMQSDSLETQAYRCRCRLQSEGLDDAALSQVRVSEVAAAGPKGQRQTGPVRGAFARVSQRCRLPIPNGRI